MRSDLDTQTENENGSDSMHHIIELYDDLRDKTRKSRFTMISQCETAFLYVFTYNNAGIKRI